MHFQWALCTLFEDVGRIREFCLYNSVLVTPLSLISAAPAQRWSQTSFPLRVQVSLTKFNHLRKWYLLSSLAPQGRSSLVWAERSFSPFPLGCVLHLLLCLCKTCNDFTIFTVIPQKCHTTMTLDFQGAPRWRCKVRRETENTDAG